MLDRRLSEKNLMWENLNTGILSVFQDKQTWMLFQKHLHAKRGSKVSVFKVQKKHGSCTNQNRINGMNRC